MKDLVCIVQRYCHKTRHLFACFEVYSSSVTPTVNKKLVVWYLFFNPMVLVKTL